MHSVNFLEKMSVGASTGTPKSVSIPSSTRLKKRKKGRSVSVIGAIVAVLAVILFIWLGWIVGGAASAALKGKAAAEQAGKALENGDFFSADHALTEAEVSLALAEAQLEKISRARFLPWIGTQAEKGERLLRVGRETASAIHRLVRVGMDVQRLLGNVPSSLDDLEQGIQQATTFEDLSPAVKEIFLRRLSNAAPDLAVTSADLRLALSELDAVRREGVPASLDALLESVRNTMKQLLSAVDLAAIGARVLPGFAGLDQPSQTLLLFLNNHELRPGGGFIGAYGLLAMDRGELSAFTTKDSYTLDLAAEPFFTAAPPEPLRQYNATSTWFFRDANWSPDFAVSSQQAIQLFTKEILSLPPALRASVQPPVSITGVIGFTPAFGSSLLKFVGPITIDGQTFTAENLADALEYQVEIAYAREGIPVSQRKELLAAVADEVKRRLLVLPRSQWSAILEMVQQALDRKELVVYSADVSLEDVLTKAGWGGRFVPGPGDQLAVVDANLASLKSDPSVRREIRYTLRPEEGTDRFLAEVVIRYVHMGSFDWKTTRYRTYTRVYAPLGSELLGVSGSFRNDRLQDPSGAPGQADVGAEIGFTVFGAFTSVEPGQTQELRFTYRLPLSVSDVINSDSYHLDIFKQIGSWDPPLTLDLDFGNKEIRSAAPAEEEKEWGDGIYRAPVALTEDRTVQIFFRP